MESIKEKAIEYGLQYPVIHYDADGNPYDDVDNPSTDFEEGANYVLISNKGLCVAHFHRMAINWYKKTHLSKWAQELVNNN